MIVTISSTQKRQVIDFTEDIQKLLDNSSGVVHMLVRHTTAALTTADLDPGTDLDLIDFLNAITPDLKWRHPHNSSHAPDHLISSIIGPSLSVPYQNGKLSLGAWQRIIIVELNGPRQREIDVIIK